MMSSATRGQPRRPRRVATAPSCICAPSVSAWSSACWMRGRSNVAAYSRARRMTALLVTQRPSSLTATAPASLRSAISVSCSPFWPTVIAPIGCRRTPPVARAFATSPSVTTRESFTGDVLGMQHTSTKPPAAAARRPLATSSLPSAPGSRRCAWMSTRPGSSHAPGRSTTRTRSPGSSPAAASRPTRVIWPRSTTTSTSASSPPAGSTARTRRKTRASVMRDDRIAIRGAESTGFGGPGAKRRGAEGSRARRGVASSNMGAPGAKRREPRGLGSSRGVPLEHGRSRSEA